MVRATRVAVATASSIGTSAARACLVSSIINTMLEIGACVVVATMAPAPSTAYNLGCTPSRNGRDHRRVK